MFRVFLLPVLASLTALVGIGPPAVDRSWEPPVDAPVVDPFRPPSTPYGPGNRGLEYGTTGGESVRAVADGTVTFARRIGASRYIVVDHHGGLRSTYAYVESISVARGQRVRQGQIIATAAPGFHLTARLGDVYVDPMRLFAGEQPRPRLVPLSPTERPSRTERSRQTERSGQVVPVPPSIRMFVPVMAPA